MNTNEQWMTRALELARQAAERAEVPVGALVIAPQPDGRLAIIAEAHNRREEQHSVLGHAEVLALKMASEKLQSWRLLNCILVTTLEPCVMCAGAIIQSRIQQLIYGAADPKGGAQSLFGLFDSKAHNHRVNWTSGVLEAECSEVLKTFFKAKRI